MLLLLVFFLQLGLECSLETGGDTAVLTQRAVLIQRAFLGEAAIA